ncbi:MAG: gliding motility-associated C-terminal domain-containing protein [Lentimicrobium sp.]|nr:gliding motility-associated C-terminal domain-containing protein [Lentimicrobium sp.]
MLRISFQRASCTLTIIVLFMTQMAFKASAAPPIPELLSLSVEANGSITAGWIIPSGTFDGFKLYYRPSGSTGTPSLVDFPASAINGSIPVSDGMNTGYEAYLVTYIASEESNASSTLRTIMLTVSNSGTGTGIARLDWNRMNPGVAEYYSIQRSIDNGISFSQIGETGLLTYYDTIQEYNPNKKLCDDTEIFYRVFCETSVPQAVSSVASGIFRDDNLPEDPVLSYVTIVNGFSEVHWTHSPTQDVNGYVIGLNEGGTFNDHTTVDYTDFFTDDLTGLPTYHDPCNEVVTYVIRAIDQCNNSSSGVVNYNNPHHTILLKGDMETLCNRKASLSWNAYDNMNPAVNEYKVMRSFNGDPAAEIGLGISVGDGNYSFIDDELLVPGGNYSYYIQAVNADNSLSSESCHVLLTPEPEVVESFELDNITVTDNLFIDLTINGTPISAIDKVEILRSAVNPSSLAPIISFDWNNPNMIISENSADVNSTSYYYQLRALDACGFEIATSKVFKSIFLQFFDSGDGDVRLNWNEFEGWEISGYNVFCLLNGQLVDGFPKFLPPGTLVFNDPDAPIESGMITYYVEAVQDDDDQVNSRSNEVLLVGEPEIITPTAFSPNDDGLNDLFKPYAKNIDTGKYLFTIYNRWGQRVFETKAYPGGWDGTIKGAPAPPGIYGYIIDYSDFYGFRFFKRGIVNLLR